ncbi:hypothetical protein B0O80DRAFT_447424 [Mortierella sp. GBAus27b]|nr:hypothetical protein B0O80DRAFT_447424 [Mortierella sp. GBAus27b]
MNSTRFYRSLARLQVGERTGPIGRHSLSRWPQAHSASSTFTSSPTQASRSFNGSREWSELSSFRSASTLRSVYTHSRTSRRGT